MEVLAVLILSWIGVMCDIKGGATFVTHFLMLLNKTT